MNKINLIAKLPTCVRVDRLNEYGTSSCDICRLSCSRECILEGCFPKPYPQFLRSVAVVSSEHRRWRD